RGQRFADRGGPHHRHELERCDLSALGSHGRKLCELVDRSRPVLLDRDAIDEWSAEFRHDVERWLAVPDLHARHDEEAFALRDADAMLGKRRPGSANEGWIIAQVPRLIAVRVVRDRAGREAYPGDAQFRREPDEFDRRHAEDAD